MSQENKYLSSSDSKKPLVLIGSGGHASVLIDILRLLGRKVVAVVSPDAIAGRVEFSGLEHLKKDSDLNVYSREEVLLVNGIGSIPGSDLRRKLALYYQSQGFKFETIVAPTAVIADTASLGQGVQVLTGAVINPGAEIGDHVVVNTRVVIEHDCLIDKFVGISPNATVCGNTKIGEGSTIGPGAVVAQSLNIGANVIVGAGASVVKSVDFGCVILPAKPQLTFTRGK